MKEIWKDIKGYEGLYQISNKGKVKSLPKLKRNKMGIFVTKEKMLKPSINSYGYLRIELKKDGIKKRFFIHRLVAENFLQKENKNFNVVNHLDCNVQNNNVNNLEWTTLKGNSEYMGKLGRNKRTKTWIEKLKNTQTLKYGKKVLRISLDETEITEYKSVNDAKKDGFKVSSVSRCCNHKSRIHKGYMWRFKDEEI